MGWGRWYAEFDGPCRAVVQGRTVWALGSGTDGREYRLLHRLGAACVMEVDKELRRFPDEIGHRKLEAAYRIFGGTWTELMGTDWSTLPAADVALVKWPANSHIWRGEKGVHDVLHRIPCFIYVGRNGAGTACAPRQFWDFCLGRELLHEVWGDQNDLLIYGKRCPERQPSCREEIAALSEEFK